jgi:single-stranded-DNA-specific exonuclease
VSVKIIRPQNSNHSSSEEKTISSHEHLIKLICANRGVTYNDEFEERNLNTILPYTSLSNIKEAAQIIYQSITKQDLIVIAGDFDADGATATALAIKALRQMGAKNLDYIVPNRFKYGYGLTKKIVSDMLLPKKPQLVITVDNGISSIEGVQEAVDAGIKVIITDHHLPGDELPKADAIVNPNIVGDKFPSKNLSGVGVCYYLMQALHDLLIHNDWYKTNGLKTPDLSLLLDYVALGTVADLVPLDKNNRSLVYHGLKVIWDNKCSIAIQSLIKICQKNHEIISAADLGFAIGPRINAAGRLEDMSIGIDFLLNTDPESSLQQAENLDALNAERKVIESTMQEQAALIMETMNLDKKNSLPSGLTLFDPSWHQGVIGILASRVKEKTKRPVVIFTEIENQILKGSARSVSGIHIRDVFTNLCTKNPDLFISYGGHSMAAGLSIHRKDLDVFTKGFNELVHDIKPNVGLQEQTIKVDGQLDPNLLNISTAEFLLRSNPWGLHFKEPIFEGSFNVVSQKIVGQAHMKLILSVINEPILLDAMCFFVDLDLWPDFQAKQVKLYYRLVINEYRNMRKCQLLVQHIEPIYRDDIIKKSFKKAYTSYDSFAD